MSTPQTGAGRMGRGGRKGGGRGGRGGRGRGGAKSKTETTTTPQQQTASSKNKPADNDKGKKGPRSRNRNRGGNKQQQQQNNAPELTPEEIQQQQEVLRKEQEAEAERRRLEEEEKAKVQAEKQRQEQQKQLEDELIKARDTLQALTETIQQRASSRAALEPEALAAARKEFEANKKKLKTDLKKCTAFVKKIKSGTAWAMRPADLTKDVGTLNLSRYVEEVVSAILETKPKVTDLPVIVALCQAMHCRYPEFMSNLVPSLWSVIHGKTGDSPDSAKLRRLYIRLVTELFLSGLITETKTLVKTITEAAGGKDESYAVQDAHLLVAFCKSASPDILGVTPLSAQNAVALIRKHTSPLQADDEKGDGGILASEAVMQHARNAADAFEKALPELPPATETNETLAKHCKGAYETLSATLVQTHHKLQKLEKRCEQDRLLSGSLTDAREKGLADARKLKDSLQKGVEALSDALALPMPYLEEEEEDAGEGGGLGVEVWTKGEGGEDSGPFDDEETKAFYCDIPDLLTTVPPALLGISPQEIERRKEENARKYGAEEGDADEEEDTNMEVTPSSEAQLEAEEEQAAAEGDATNESTGNEDKDGEENKDTPHYRLMVLLEQELPECNRREQIDEITERFVTNHGSSKNSRKRLMKTLFLVPRSRLDLLPYYSRMAATLDRVWGEMAQGLVTELEQQFHGQTKFKKNQNIESRMKTARYVGELTKFRVAPPMVFLRCMRRCLEDFTGSNVDVACCLLESAGRFLYRLRHTNQRIIDMMDTMTRLSKAKHLDERLQSLIKAAFYSVKPPPSGPRKQAKEYPPLEAYLRCLLLERLTLSNSSVSFVSKQIGRMPWSDPSQQCGALVCRLMMKACRRGRYKTIQAIAMVAANLRTQRTAGEATVRLVDSVLEELRWAIEFPDFRDQQRTITYARLLGELFCTSQVPAQVILQQLYDFINIGHEIPEALREASRKLASEAADDGDNEGPSSQLPVYNSASGVSQTIQEDEEMEEVELETKEEEKVAHPQPVAVSEHSKFDPRVPTPKDPPNASYRVKLVCTLLEVTAQQIATRNNLPRLKGFLTAFQRYLFTKTMLPTDVEFSLLDTFDVLDSQWRRLVKSSRSSAPSTKETGFPRFATWIEAHNATVAIEESEALFEEQQRAKLAAGMSESRASANDDDSTSMLDDYDEASFSASARDSVTEGNEDEMDQRGDDGEQSQFSSDENEVDDEDDGDESDSDGASDLDDEEEFDEEAHMKKLEQEAFERELRRVTMESLDKGKSSSRKLVADYMPTGSQFIKKKQTPVLGPKPGEVVQPPPPAIALGGKTGISFQILQKGNKGKVEAKELIVPSDTNLAMVATKQDDEAARERDVIKQRVLQYEAESAEAEYSGGNVYLEQEKLQVIRNRPLSMAEIDKNFGTTGGNLLRTDEKAKSSITAPGRGGRAPAGRGGRGGRGRGRGRSSSSGRILF